MRHFFIRYDRGFVLVLLLSATAALGQDIKQGSGDPRLTVLMVYVGNALVDSSDGNWASAREHLVQFGQGWTALKPKRSTLSQGVDRSLEIARRAVGRASEHPVEAKSALSRLAIATDDFVRSVAPAGIAKADEYQFRLMQNNARRSLDYLKTADIERSASTLQLVATEWLAVENEIRAIDPAAYGRIEIATARARAALRANPPDPAAAEESLGVLIQTLDDFGHGIPKVAPPASGRTPGIDDLLTFLRQAHEDLAKGDQSGASEKMQAFIEMWPFAEGAVSTRSAATYAAIENEMTEAAGLLMSADSASGGRGGVLLQTMIQQLEGLDARSAYTLWDAAVILFREGMEALLVLAALLGLLRKSERKEKEAWVWAGAGTGLAVSGLLAVLLVTVVSRASSGAAREGVEGFVGLASVALMLGLGTWLHRRSNLQAWNSFIKKTVGGALAKGSMWSIYALAVLAVLREGAESVVFYVGIAPDISTPALLAGIASALAVLIVIGYLLIRFSMRLPLHQFFLVATILIYYLAFKITGESIHALQVIGAVRSHHEDGLPSLGLIGLYPTWETLVPQVLVLCFVLASILFTELRRPKTPKVG